MKVVILAGGKGQRLFPETEDKPKPMVEIGGKPVIWHIMKIYSSFGIRDFIICAGYRSFAIKEYFSDYYLVNADVIIDVKNNKIKTLLPKAEPWRITIVDTGENTDTAERIKMVESFLRGEEIFCLSYGDTLADVNIKEEIEYHRKLGKLVTALVVRHPARYVEWKITREKIEFIKKPSEELGWFCGGFFVVSGKIFNYLKNISNWNEVLFKLNEINQLGAYKHRGFWFSLETLKDKFYLEELWNTGKAPWKLW